MGYNKFRKTLSLPKEEEEKLTYEEIEEGVYFRGHNLWLLVLSMGIACVGLNINSPAAVIGAMLISPLMGPIVGLAFGLSINDKNLVKLSIWNWGIMLVTALFASTIYFIITPFHSETSQLASFKEATIFDCLLALFGGFAWFLGIIRKEAIKVIAGVAVATACIPPLCTAGYGLANLNWDCFFGGLYFYLINCVFIGIGTWVLSIFLGYQKYYLQKNPTLNKTTSAIITLLSILILLPSVFFTIKKWRDENLKQRADQYVKLIREKNPELGIVHYEVFEKNKKKYLDITLINDSAFVSKKELNSHDALVQDINLVWHYSENSKSNGEIKFLQKQIDDLKKQLEKQKK